MSTQPTTLHQWRYTGRPCDDLGVQFKDDSLMGLSGRTYAPRGAAWIAQRPDGSWWAMLGRDEASGTLERVEEAAHAYWVDELADDDHIHTPRPGGTVRHCYVGTGTGSHTLREECVCGLRRLVHFGVWS